MEKIVLKGVVQDARTNEPIPFVNIGLLGTVAGVASDVDGRFELVIPDRYATHVLRLSAIGYASKDIKVYEIQNKPDLKILLQPKTYGIDLHIAALMLNGGRHVDDPRVIYTKTSSLFVETEDDINRPVMINLDGEYGGEAPMHFQNLHQHIEFFANTDQIPDEAITGTDEEELEVVSKEFVKEVERLTDEDIDGDGKIADETPNQKN